MLGAFKNLVGAVEILSAAVFRASVAEAEQRLRGVINSRPVTPSRCAATSDRRVAGPFEPAPLGLAARAAQQAPSAGVEELVAAGTTRHDPALAL